MLADASPPKRRRGSDCSVGTALTTLPETEATALQAMLDSRAWTDSATWDACKAEGYVVSEQMIGKHRRRRCGCFR